MRAEGRQRGPVHGIEWLSERAMRRYRLLQHELRWNVPGVQCAGVRRIVQQCSQRSGPRERVRGLIGMQWLGRVRLAERRRLRDGVELPERALRRFRLL